MPWYNDLSPQSIARRELIMVLARVTPSSTKLVESILRLHKEYNELK